MSGMDHMSSTTGGMSAMKMYFHGSIGTDILWFASWVPSSAGATVGVCLGVFVIAIFERWLAALRRACEHGWQRGQVGLIRPTTNGPYNTPPSPNTTGPERIPLTSGSSLAGESKDSTRPDTVPARDVEKDTLGDESGPSNETFDFDPLPRAARQQWRGERRWARPWRVWVDVPRGLLQALQTLIHYLLMLVAMTFNIWWILSVVIGSGVGEIMFGRFGPSSADH
ncbi:Ctr copper transporter [Papiliotrema laurentii]|uniref:Copper transport protein n=1 Tax=Papiliotrema laurentii TaxID=5418 RepID=A0AAD9CY73_PAPLA|nr:Ctr copper transporter [Papiliotrema laurentii]